MAATQPGWQTPDQRAPVRDAFHLERVVDPFTRSETIGMVRHAGHAWVADLPPNLHDGGTPDDDAHWQALGAAYLQALADALDLKPGQAGWLPVAVWERLVPPGPTTQQPARGLAWLPITWGRRPGGRLEARHPLGSFLLSRQAADGLLTDRSLVLLAGCARHGLLTGSDMGLRLALHLREGQAWVHGVTLSGLGGERALDSAPAGVDDAGALFHLVNKLRAPIGRALGQGKDQELGQAKHLGIWVQGLERLPDPGAPPQRLRVSGHMRRVPVAAPRAEDQGSGQGRARVHDFLVELDVLGDPQALAPLKVQVLAVRRNEFAGSAAVDFQGARAFLADGASAPWPPETPPVVRAAGLAGRRPTRPEANLQPLRLPLLLPLPLGVDGDCELRFGSGPGTGTADNPAGLLFETRGPRPSKSALAAATMQVDGSAVVKLPPVAPVPGAAAGRDPAQAAPALPAPAPFWTDTQASVEAHVRAAELFDRLAAYGFDPHALFRFARLPLVQRARAALQWVPDGDMASAEVRPFLGDGDLDEDQDGVSASSRPQLLVKYGSADPMHRRLVPLAGDGADVAAPQRSRAQYLGVAADPRWAWHEFGHVLNHASTGELEFAFAHSAGDALGAIAADPLSVLAPADDPESPLRFQTYPWIEVPGRLHGRRARDGYCWCGRRNLLRLDFSAPLERHHHGYFEEQLLSSSLFRLYRSLGGDTGGYLQPPVPPVPPALADQADQADEADEADQAGADVAIRLATADWCLYLVMRAIALLGPDSVAPARTADQFVSALIDADLGTGLWQVQTHWPLEQGLRNVRRRGGWSHKVIRWAFERQGLYATEQPRETVDGTGLPPAVDVFIADCRPVTGADAQPGSYAPVPLRQGLPGAPWQADPQAVQLDDDGLLRLQLRNRGRLPAAGLRLRAWWADDTGPQGDLSWSAPIGLTPAAVVPAGDAAPLPAELHGLPRPAGRAGWLLVAVDAAADPSNLPAAARPPDRHDDLVQLVAADNNLALLYRPAR